MPFSSGIPIFSRIHVLVFRSVQLILGIRRHTHISKAMSSFSSHFFSAQLSNPYDVGYDTKIRAGRTRRNSNCTANGTRVYVPRFLNAVKKNCFPRKISLKWGSQSTAISNRHGLNTARDDAAAAAACV